MTDNSNQQPAVTSLLPVYGSLPEPLEDSARQLRRRLADLHRAYMEDAEPYLKALARIESVRQIKGYITVPENPRG